LFSGGLHVALIAKNNWGVQTGIKYTGLSQEFFYERTIPDEFLSRKSYKLFSNFIEVPLHGCYDLFKIPSGNSEREPRYLRIFAGPTIGFDFQNRVSAYSFSNLFQAPSTLSSTFRDSVIFKKWVPGFELGFNINPVNKKWLSIGVLYHYNLASVAFVDFVDELRYSSSNISINDETVGKMNVKGDYVLIQIAIKPMVLWRKQNSSASSGL
jgi:hypothetical protein